MYCSLLTAEYNLDCLIVEVNIGPKEFRNYCTCIKRIMSEGNGVRFVLLLSPLVN